MSKSLVKIAVCTDCMSPLITDANCICTYQKNYDTIELEFEKCECCRNTNAHPADTEFNKKQYKTL